MRIVTIALLILVASACTSGPHCPCNPFAGGGSPTSPSTSSGYSDADLQFCVDQTNADRALVNLPALVRSSTLEAYAAIGAQQDGANYAAHSHLLATGGGGVASAENEIPWWPTAQFTSARAVIAQGLAVMWAEGPGGTHYQNLVGSFASIGCGIYIATGEITVTQDFR